MIAFVDDESLSQDELFQRLEAKRDELDRTIGRGSLPAEMKAVIIEGMLVDEAARLTGADPALARATAAVREHGLRGARKFYRDGSIRALIDDSADAREMNDRIAAYIEDIYVASTPRWRRRLGL